MTNQIPIDCPDSATWELFADSHTRPGERFQVHLQGCESCSKTFAEHQAKAVNYVGPSRTAQT